MISLFSGVDLLERKKIKNIAMRGCAAIAVKLQNTGVKAIELSSVFIRKNMFFILMT